MIGKLLLGIVVGAASTRGLKCTFGHKWNGCTCENCGTVRDEHHRMVSVPGECTERCAICGKTGRTVHKMVSVSGECTQRCAICGEIGRTMHKYRRDPDTGDHICVVCGISKKDEDRKKLKVALGIGSLFILLLLLLLAVEHPVLGIGLIVLFILCGITAMLLRHLHLMRQQDIDILNADVNKMGGDEAARRAEKYRDK